MCCINAAEKLFKNFPIKGTGLWKNGFFGISYQFSNYDDDVDNNIVCNLL